MKTTIEKDKFYLLFLSLTTLSLLMPWIKIPILGSISAINQWQGMVGFFLLLGIIGLYFYKKEFSFIASFGFLGGVILYILYVLIRYIVPSIDLGLFGEFSPLLFIGFGVYMFLLGGIGTVIVSGLEIKQKKNNLYMGLGAVALILLIIILSTTFNTKQTSQELDFDDIFSDFNDNSNFYNDESSSVSLNQNEFTVNDIIQFNGIQIISKNFIYEDTSEDTWNWDPSGYVYEFEVVNTNNNEITVCDFDFDYIGVDGKQIRGTDFYGYSSIYGGAKKEYSVRFTSDDLGKGGIIYAKPPSYGSQDCPNFIIKITI